jgi:thiamine pyrophosphate-dependent acetolactate synthase large subunit-like protein
MALPLVVLIFRDDGYGSIRWKQVQGFQPTAGVGYLAAPTTVARYDERRSPRRRWYGDAR